MESQAKNKLMDAVKEDVDRACKVLEEGGIILYPTDTIWGLGCDATNAEAVKKIFGIKKRDDSKALITLVPDAAWIERYVDEVPEVAWQLLEVADKPLTIIYDKARNLAANLPASDGSIGLRVTKELYTNTLLNRFRRPIVSTSANISGEKSPANFSEISQEIIDSVDYTAHYRRDEVGIRKPSSIIKLGKGGVFKIIR